MDKGIEESLLKLIGKVDYLQDDITSLKEGQETIIKMVRVPLGNKK